MKMKTLTLAKLLLLLLTLCLAVAVFAACDEDDVKEAVNALTEQTGTKQEQTQTGTEQTGTEQGQTQTGTTPAGDDTQSQTPSDGGQSAPAAQTSDPTAAQPASASDFTFEAYGSGYAVTAYTGTDKTVTIPATYNGKNVVAIGTSKRDGERLIADGMANAFDVEEILIPDTVREIGHGAFRYCVSLKELHIPNVVRVGRGAFMDCPKLTKVTIDGGILDVLAFERCSQLKEIVLGANVTGIQSEALADCTALECITLYDITEVAQFGELFRKVLFTYQDWLEPETVTNGTYSGVSINGYSVIYNKPAANTKWLLPHSTNGWGDYQGQKVLWDGNPAISVSNYTTTGYMEDSWKEPKYGTFYGYTVPQTLKTITITKSCNYNVSKCKNNICSSIAVVLPHTYAETWTANDTQHWHAATCGHDLKTDIANHTWGEWTVTKEPTCTETGTREHTCTVCGKTVSESIPVTSIHTYATVWSSNDTQHWHAANCGHNAKSDTANHTWGEWVIVKDSTCGETGTREHTCTICGKTVSETIALKEHTYSDEWTSNDTQHWHNAVCGHEVTADTANHTWGAWRTTKAATCTETGTREHTCTVCGKTVSETTAIIAHSYGAWVVTKAATCTETGTREHTCTVCGQTVSETVAMVAHNYDANDCCTTCGYNKHLTFTLSGNSYTVKGNDTSVTKLVIPNAYKGLPVTAIADSAFSGYSKLKTVVIPDSVTSIGQGAFRGCTGLTSITVADENTVYHSAGNCLIQTASKTLIAGCKNSIIPTDGSVTSIGGYAFYGCIGLTSITIPSSVASIGNYAFDGCTGLTAVYITDLAAWCGISFGYFGNPLCYAHNLYINEELATEITIPNSATSIGSYTFHGCTGLTSITIPNSVTSIGMQAFSGCTGLTAVYITDLAAWCGISFGGADANPLYYAHNLYISGTLATEVTISNSATSIGNYAFYGCTGLTSVTIPDSVTSIGSWAFEDCTGLTSVTIGNGVTRIGTQAFWDCSKLKSITIPDSVTSVGDSAFANCNKLTYNTYNNAKYLGNAQNPYVVLVKATSTSITSCTIHANTKVIADDAFFCCTGLTSITIPDGVTRIGNYAFYECSSLTSITIPDSVTSIGQEAFRGCTGLTSITVADENTVYHSAGNCVIETASKTLIAGCKKSIIPTDGSVTSIGSWAFEDCTGLTSITIPDSVTSIGDFAFYNCTGLRSVTIGNGVTNIGGSAFSRCTGLTSITIPDSVTSIGSNAFSNCTGLTNVTFTNTTGWYRIYYNGTSGKDMDVTNATTNAANLKTNNYYWYRK